MLGGSITAEVKYCIQYREDLWSEAVQLNRFMLKHCCVSSQNFAWLKMIEFIKLLSKIHIPFLISFPQQFQPKVQNPVVQVMKMHCT